MALNEGRFRTVLLVDDSADEAEFVRRALASSHPAAALTVFRSGAEILEYISRAAVEGSGAADLPYVVLLDLKLPGLDGHATLAALRKRYSGGELPVVVFTSSREPTDVSRAYAAGANGYVVKPLVYEEYMEMVASVGSYWLDANVPLRAVEESGA